MALSPKLAAFVKDNNERVAQSRQRIAVEAFNASVTAQLIDLALRKATKADLHRIVRNAVTEETA